MSFSLVLIFLLFSESFLNCFTSLGLTQWVKSPTFIYSDNILNLILTSEDDRLRDIAVHPAIPGCGHCLLTFKYYFLDNRTVVDSCGYLRRSWHRGNYGQIERCLLNVDWDFEFDGLCLDEMVCRTFSILSPLIARYVPYSECKRPRSRFNPPDDWLGIGSYLGQIIKVSGLGMGGDLMVQQQHWLIYSRLM